MEQIVLTTTTNDDYVSHTNKGQLHRRCQWRAIVLTTSTKGDSVSDTDRRQLHRHHRWTTTALIMTLQSDPHPRTLRNGVQKRREKIFFLLFRVFLLLFFFFFSFSKAAIRTIHYMTVSSKTHRSAQPRR